MTELRFGIVGAGRIATAYADALARSQRARLAAVADTRAQAAQAFGEGYGCPGYSSHQEMAGENLDGVIVCTPPVTHQAICLDFLDRGVPVLCEKPLSIDTTSALRMIETARNRGLTFTMASKFRYVEDVARAKSIIASGTLGEIVLFEMAFTSVVDMGSRWNSDPAVSGGGVLIDNGTHAVDLARYFLGPLGEVQVVEGKRNQGLPVEETVRIFVRSTDGVLGSIDLSWSINKELDSYINIHGSGGSLSVGWRESKYRLFSGRDWVVFGNGYDKVEAFRRQLDNFAGAIMGTEPLLIDCDDALASVQVIEAAYADLRRSHWIPVLDVPAGNGRTVAESRA
jgi:predicted dehydrogenase